MYNINKKYYFLTFVFCFALVSNYFSQKYSFTNFNVDDGLPQSTVYEIYQDKLGFLWIGTDGGGLSRYDGYRFKQFGKKNGLNGNVIKKIIEDNKNNIWIATNNGLYYLKNDSIFILKEIPNNNSIYFTSVIIDSKQNIWATSTGNGIYKIKNVEGKFIVKNYSTSDGLSSDHVFDICEDKQNRIWVAAYGAGIDILEGENNKIRNVNLNSKELNEIISLKCINKSTVAFGTRFAGAYLINTEITKKTSYRIINGTQNNQVWSFSIDENENSFVATDNNGVICNEDEYRLDNTVGLISNKVFKVFFDKEKNLWIGTNQGLVKYSGSKYVFITPRELPELTEGTTIVQEEPQVYWIGSNSGIYKIHYKNNKSTILKHITSNDGLLSNEIKHLCIAKDKSIWISTQAGLSKYDGKRIINFNEENGLAGNSVNYVINDSKGRFWVGTSGGLSLINEKNELSNMSESNGLVHNEVTCLFEDSNKHIWIGTYGGLMKFDGEKLETFTEKSGLDEKKINCLTQNKKGSLLIGTFGGGIYEYNINNNKIKLLCSETMLTSGNITTLKFKNDSVLIAGTNLGLNKILFNKNNKLKSIQQIGKLNGFENLENNINSVLKDSDNNFWFGTTKGVTIYQSKCDKINLIKPIINLKSIKVNDKAILNANNITLNHNQNTLKASFVSISLTSPQANMYFSKLVGLDSNWNKLLIDKDEMIDFVSTEYKNLQPGKYQLMLKSKNNDGIESDVYTVNFEIKQPYYKTTLFIILCIITFIIIVYLFFKYRERNLIKEKEKLEAIVTERTSEVVASKKEIEKQKELVELQKHEITDSINYSKRIQNAILPEQSLLFNNFKNSFILYKPKDIVSGDFYFFAQGASNKFYIAVADCTGHGVPGAFMSMIGSKELSEVVKNNHQPSTILSALNIGIRKTLKQSNLEIGIKDGMDIAFISIEKDEKNELLNISFSGANRPLWVLKKNSKEITEIKATKTAIGGYTQDDQVFEQHDIKLEKGDSFYLFSDGYADQFGGNSGKKMMTKRFKEILIENSNIPMNEQNVLLSNYFTNWMGETNEQVDDVLIIGIIV